MKSRIRNIFVLPALLAFGLAPIEQVTAQTFTTLHNFTGDQDGLSPRGGLVLLGDALYGTTTGYGSGSRLSTNSTIFVMNTYGTAFTNIFTFGQIFPSGSSPTNSDGTFPNNSLILVGDTLYGTANNGGHYGKGTVFSVRTDGTGFTNLHNFSGSSDGTWPRGLVISSNILYGATASGGSWSNGTIFSLRTDGAHFKTLHNFTAMSGSSFTNVDGASPYAGVVISENTLYGTAQRGGKWGSGTVFSIRTDGDKFTTMHNFSSFSDGSSPHGRLLLSGGVLYGTANGGGGAGGRGGTVFKVSTNGTGFTKLYSFSGNAFPSTNNDGANPSSGLVLSEDTLYGTTLYGGISGEGIVFAVQTNGTGFTNLHTFTATSGPLSTNSDGTFPTGDLIFSGHSLYGTAHGGGGSGGGTVFRISFQQPEPPRPLMNMIRSGGNLILLWPTNAVGFVLQSATDAIAPNAWSIVSPEPVIIGGQNVVVDSLSSTQKFYRLTY